MYFALYVKLCVRPRYSRWVSVCMSMSARACLPVCLSLCLLVCMYVCTRSQHQLTVCTYNSQVGVGEIMYPFASLISSESLQQTSTVRHGGQSTSLLTHSSPYSPTHHLTQPVRNSLRYHTVPYSTIYRTTNSKRWSKADNDKSGQGKLNREASRNARLTDCLSLAPCAH